VPTKPQPYMGLNLGVILSNGYLAPSLGVFILGLIICWWQVANVTL